MVHACATDYYSRDHDRTNILDNCNNNYSKMAALQTRKKSCSILKKSQILKICESSPLSPRKKKITAWTRVFSFMNGFSSVRVNPTVWNPFRWGSRGWAPGRGRYAPPPGPLRGPAGVRVRVSKLFIWYLRPPTCEKCEKNKMCRYIMRKMRRSVIINLRN